MIKNTQFHLQQSTGALFVDAYATCFSQLVQCEAIYLQISLEALLVHPQRQTGVFVLCDTGRQNPSGSDAQKKAR